MYISYEGLPGKEVLCVQLPGFIDHRFKVVKAKYGWKFFVQDSARKFPGKAPPFPAEAQGLAGAGSGTPFGWIRRGARETVAICIGYSIQRLNIFPVLWAHMTNWEMREKVTFRCPDCGHIQQAMTPECPACKNIRTSPVRFGHSVHCVSFGMNGGQRRERYRMLLTDEQALAFLSLCNSEAYNLLGSLWDQVINASVDAGCDYEGLGVEVLLAQDKNQ